MKNKNIKVWKKEHPGYLEYLIGKKVYPEMPCLFGQWQYFYEVEGKGKIDAVFLPNHLGDGRDFWEIYCLEGELFEDVERYPTLEDAEERIEELLR